ncbi:insulinase family protein [Peptoniphilus sp. KCTC 25270]|uniref:insulinase family protein n=1 Tax=Peptoniphilus sp. KCTC 25270 TaxID=2897414 RepID=UPI001E5D7208|nr:insulinase family protein [Peptoniphilus sp. KCTC 25270]MCD1146826.1 insulinase family protein [Peptoniphilus sp. KCTC 25270]
MKDYKLLQKEYVQDLQAEVSLYLHEETKAQILWIDNKNHNKTFSIGFKTPPTDSTGIAHIVEHSTLSGSRKYHTKEPFMDMVATSMQTFLNAMTYPDKTIYPISSRNDKDFKQLMDLYLDSVFYPRMKEIKEIFLQEGWHEEIQQGELIYNGVVYNEMKGVYSDPSNQVSDIIRENLHPAGTYHHDSGGNPQYIPNLTYENFLDFHKKYYHPSNSYILLAGDLDLEERLNYLHEEYLSHFSYLKPISDIISHEPYTEIHEYKDTYSISQEEFGENKNYFALSWNIKENPSPMDLLLRSFFSELLVGSDDGILKKNLLHAGIGEDVYVETSAGNTLDFSIISYHAPKNLYENFQKIIEKTFQDILEDGFDKKDLLATLNKFEYSVRQGGGSHRDLIAYIGSLNLWLYGGNPIEALQTSKYLKEMREGIETDFFERKLKEFFIDTKNKTLAFIAPEINKQTKVEEEIKTALQKRKNSLSEEELEAIQQQQEALLIFQNTEDSPEAKATIPSLEREDISKEITEIPRKLVALNQAKGTLNPQPTNGILYYNLAFSLKHFDLEELQWISILSDFYGRIATKEKSLTELNQEIYLNTGGISFETPVETHKNPNVFTPYMMVRFTTLKETIPQAFSIVKEIFESTEFEDEKRVREILFATKADLESSILQSGHTISSARLKSYFHKGSYVDEMINGLELYFVVSDLIENFSMEVFQEKVNSIKEKIFLQNNLVFNIVGEEDLIEYSLEEFEKFIHALPTFDLEEAAIPFEVAPRNEGFLSSSQVNYVSKGYNLALLDQSYSGEFVVLGNLLSNKYLHNNIRAKGGAYGAGVRFGRGGLMTTYSYRDPNLENTLLVYDGIAEYLENLELTEKDLTNLIIGTMNSFDPHMPPHSLGFLDFKRYLNQVENKDILKWKEEAMNVTLENLKSYAPTLRKAMEKNYLCVIGNEEKIKEHSEFFEHLIPLKR